MSRRKYPLDVVGACKWYHLILFRSLFFSFVRQMWPLIDILVRSKYTYKSLDPDRKEKKFFKGPRYNMMKNLWAALQFLTILPLGQPVDFPGYRMVTYFPVAGLFIGLLLALIDVAFQHIFPSSIVSLIDVVFLAVVTGALHLDGLADTADGLFSHRSRGEIMGIMKDSRVGTMGVLALLFVLGIKWACISSLYEHRACYLIMIPAYARGAFTIAIHRLNYIRPEGGTALEFFAGKRSILSLGWLLAPVALSLFLGFKGILLNGVFIGIVVLVLLYYKKRLEGITGDMLGALGEVTEAGLFLFASSGVCGI